MILSSAMACGRWTGAGPGCRTIVEPAALREQIQEASGIAPTTAFPGTWWVINDSGDAVVYAVASDGSPRGMVRLLGAAVEDWEDLAVAECGTGRCLYVADIGDNDHRRDTVFVYRSPEPDPGGRPVRADRFAFRYPDGPRDAEAVFVLPGERLHVVTKGSEHPVLLYRYPGTLRSDTVPTLEEVQVLSPSPRLLPRQVTGAAATLGGDTVVLRTYETLGFYRVEGDTLRLLDDGTVNLRSLREAQGEAVAIGPDGLVALASEAGPGGRRGSLAVLRCGPPDQDG